MSNTKTPQLALTYEILGAFEPTASDAVKQDALNSIEADVAFVNNTDNEVHLALPYYDCVAKISAANVSDADTADVSGGEVVVTMAILGLGVGASIIVAGGAWIGTQTDKSKK